MDDRAVSILGRTTGESEDDADPRSETRLILRGSASYCSGAEGIVEVVLRESLSDEDRGGVVVDIDVLDGSSSFVPLAQMTPTGVRLHLAGEYEAKTILQVLADVLTEYRATPISKTTIDHA